MTDIVWMRLRTVAVPAGDGHYDMSPAEPECLRHFMFGPTGVVDFYPSLTNEKHTVLVFANRKMVTVQEDQNVIFELIAKARGGIHVPQEEKAQTTDTETSHSRAEPST